MNNFFSHKRALLSYTSLFAFFFVCVWSCSGPEYTPKPKGYNRIDLPTKEYQTLQEKYPYRFEYSKHAIIRPDSGKNAELYWIHILYPKFKASIQITYKSVQQDPKFFTEFVNDSHKLTGKHMIKAYSVEDRILKTPLGKTAVVSELEGEVPSQFQFYISDSTRHFVRGALYFRTATKNDSLAPVIEFIKEDIIRMLNTFKWEGEK
jgi:gliding motility-associated lipoprotein GldD